MKIEQFKFSTDNFGYLVYADNEAIVIDGGASDAIIAYAKKKRFEILYVTNTHSHQDHTPGNQALLNQTSARFLDCRNFREDSEIKLGNEILRVIPTPGHTRDSVTFAAEDFMVTGDTLFNGTVGNCFSGDLDAFYSSLEKLLKYPGETRIWAGHDYVIESMQVAKQIEPENKDIKDYLARYNPEKVVSTLSEELKVNPYIRYNAPEMVNRLKARNAPCDSPRARFKSIMELY